MSTEYIEPLQDFSNLIQLDRIFLLVISLAILVGIVKLIQKLGSRLQVKFHHHRLQILQIVTIITFFLYITGCISLFYVILDPPKELLFALGGSAAVAIGFSLKDLVGSLFAGIVLLFDRPFQVGDRVKFNDVYGEIISIGLRAVRINTLSDDIVTIPNSKFFTDIVSSGNAGALHMMVVTDFHVGLNADIAKAKELLYEVVVTSKFVFLKKPVKIVLAETAFAERIAVKLTAKAYVLDVQYEKDFQTDIVTRTEMLFNKYQIARPSSFNI
ncbi:MAG: mechanosensitive ion channel [Spirochaetes bacterium]|nr:mechanosensitive ion channel [Spirochaetota bacterium]